MSQYFNNGRSEIVKPMDNSPINKLVSLPGFKPFSGKKAFEILKKASDKISLTDSGTQTQNLLKAVSSLGIIRKEDIRMLYELQEKICTKCGECCSNRVVKIRKRELKLISEKLGITYKKLKHKLRALPSGDNSFKIVCQPCIFKKGIGCIISELKPDDCRFFPTNYIIKAISEHHYDQLPSCEIVDELLTQLVICRVEEEENFLRINNSL